MPPTLWRPTLTTSAVKLAGNNVKGSAKAKRQALRDAVARATLSPTEAAVLRVDGVER